MRVGPGLRDVVGFAAALLLASRGVNAASAVPAQQQCDPVKPAVAGVSTPRENAERTAFLGDWVTITVCNLEGFAAEAGTHKKVITLYVEGLDTGLKAQKVDYDTGRMTFALEHNEKNEAFWAPFLYNPLQTHTEDLVVSVGEQGEKPLPRLPGANMRFTLDKIYLDWTTFVWMGLLIAVIFFCVRYAVKSDMLRDAPAVDGVRQTYSLARVQMAWWFILVVIAYVFIWLITGDRNTIPPSILALMGISAATGLAAAVVSPRAVERAAILRKAFDDEKAAIDTKVQQIGVELPSIQKH